VSPPRSHVVERRGAAVEGIHPIHFAVCSDQGVEGADTRSPWRSCAKPFQLWVALDLLGDPRFGDRDEAFTAIGASSHSGTDEQVALVRELLSALAVEEHDLGCGRAEPAHHATLYDLLARGESPAPIHNDCSAKHAFQIAAARKLGAGDYRAVDHPLQRRVAERIAELSGAHPVLATDGCALPTFDLPLTAMARAYHTLGRADDPRTRRIRDAMIGRPDLVSGPGRIDLAVSAAAREPCVAKIGARAVYALALPTRGLGIAVKCTSADEDALAAALPALLDRVAPGAFAWPDPWPWSVVRSKAGLPVGTRTLE
jgi:L-asparaginase II